MKPSKLLRWVVFGGVATVVACGGGVSSIGKGDGGGESGNTSGGSMASTGGKGATGPVGTGGSMATPTAGMGAAPSGEQCNLDRDCTQYDLPCQVCPDGSRSCSEMVCLGGKCTPSTPACDAECTSDTDCPVLDIACDMCADGTLKCPTSTCSGGVCKNNFPTCGDYCAGLPCGAMCPPATCRQEVCDPIENSFCDGKGACVAGVPQCGNAETCSVAMDCPAAPPNCVPCDDSTCAAFDCLEGKCVFTCPANPSPSCKTSEDCPPIEECKQPCPSTEKCPVNACLQNSCAPVCPL